ncbi:hypothetical protein [Emiliania huxleyi virus 99B1]|nr:hypothetical protein EhVM1_000293 [Emiliania huxleyi virus M1]CAZ69617.1 hypothetical protein [Emiliania huxleyi virus 99B1]
MTAFLSNLRDNIRNKFNSLSKPKKILLFLVIVCIVVGILIATGVIELPTQPSQEQFVYEFIVNVPAGPIHLNEVTVDGNLLPPGSFVLANAPDRNSTGPDSSLSDGTNTGVNYQNPPNAGDLFMTITLDTRPTKFTMTNSRPVYTPGWIIKENGVAIITESSNRGASPTPINVQYDYILP